MVSRLAVICEPAMRMLATFLLLSINLQHPVGSCSVYGDTVETGEPPVASAKQYALFVGGLPPGNQIDSSSSRQQKHADERRSFAITLNLLR